MTDIYCTSFCNKGHRLSDGKPVGHECYILPPSALRVELDGDFEQAFEILDATRANRRIHRGVKS